MRLVGWSTILILGADVAVASTVCLFHPVHHASLIRSTFGPPIGCYLTSTMLTHRVSATTRHPQLGSCR
jgi:hypothetical protein